MLALVVGAAALAGAAWALFGREGSRTEGAKATSSPPLAFDLSARVLPERTDAGQPLIVELRAKAKGSSSAAANAAVPAGITLEGPSELLAALEGAGLERTGKALELETGRTFDAQGKLVLALTSRVAVAGELRFVHAGTELAKTSLAWLAAPDGVAVVLPGQTFEDGKGVVGNPEAQRAGGSFDVRLVAVKGASRAEFAMKRQLRVRAGDGAPVVVDLASEATAHVALDGAMDQVRVVVEGLSGGRKVESASFRVDAAASRQ